MRLPQANKLEKSQTYNQEQINRGRQCPVFKIMYQLTQCGYSCLLEKSTRFISSSGNSQCNHDWTYFKNNEQAEGFVGNDGHSNLLATWPCSLGNTV